MIRRLFEYVSYMRRRFVRSIRNFRLPDLLTFEFWWYIFTFPFLWLFENWQSGQRLRHFLLGLPAVITACTAGILLGNAGVKGRSPSGAYWQQAEIAMQKKQYNQAELLLTRILQEDAAYQDRARFMLARLYSDTGKIDRAESLFQILAPDESRGFSKAHRRLALLLADRVSQSSSTKDKERVLWHLNAARDESSPDMALAWGRYSIAIRNLTAARKHLRVAVEQFPDLWQTLGEIELQFKNKAAAQAHYEKAANYLERKLAQTPDDYRARVDYATVLMKLGRLEDARVVLETGRSITPDGEWSTLLASLAVNFHDVLSIQNADISEKLAQLDRALQYDPNYPGALNRLMSYARFGNPENEALRDILTRAVVDSKKPALAHLALGNLSWIEGSKETAAFHFERAISIRGDMSVVLNNLAWLISHEANPDLDRALGLVEAALEQNPDRPEFLDTRGTILFKRQAWRPALDDLEKAIIHVSDKLPLHQKLARIYEEIGMNELAAGHRKKAEELLTTGNG